MKKVGFFGGTFDPIHLGHINFALSILESAKLDEVWFCPNTRSPLKNDEPKASIKMRIEMVKLAIEPIKSFQVIDIEKDHVCYTIDTLRKLESLYPGCQFRLLIGGDLAGGITHWKDWESLIKDFHPIVGGRPGEQASIEGMERVSIPLMEISATQIRKRLAGGLYVGHLVPSKVMDYITYHELYS